MFKTKITISWQPMTGKDSLVKMSGGNELPSITSRKQIIPAPSYAGQIPVRYTYEVYAKGVGKMKTHTFTSPATPLLWKPGLSATRFNNLI